LSDPKPARTIRKRVKRVRLNRKQEQRRRILRGGLTLFFLALLQPLAFLPPVRRVRDRLRPPGALEGDRFLGACIKCGQCVQVCPVEAITFGGILEGFGSGVPYIQPRAQACDFSCDALSCVLACPTGALSHEVAKKEEVRVGLARLARPDTCLARQGKPFRGLARGKEFSGRLRYTEVDRWHAIPVADHPYDSEPCDLCVIQCPIGERALRLESLEDSPSAGGRSPMTPVVGPGCVGCGVCEMICPQEPPCIVIDVPEPVRKT